MSILLRFALTSCSLASSALRVTQVPSVNGTRRALSAESAALDSAGFQKQSCGRFALGNATAPLEQWRNLASLDPSNCQHRRDEPANVRAVLLRAVEAQKTIRDGIPFVFKSSEQKACVVCLSEKVGSTAWKLLFLKSMSTQGRTHFDLKQSPHKVAVAPLPRAEQSELLFSPKVLRFMFVRDPYSRLLSGWMDKASTPQRWRDSRLPLPCVKKPSDGAATKCYTVGQPFGQFVEVATAAALLNPHFELLSKHCLLSDGMVYDYFLKTEDVSLWVGPLVHTLGLEKAAASGWEAPTKFWPGQPGGCFMAPKGVSCADALSLTSPQKLTSGGDAKKHAVMAKGQTTGPARNLHADTKLKQ